MRLHQLSESKQGVAEDFNGEYDDEAGMAQSNLRTMARAVNGLLDTIEDNDNLPEWAQEKIAKAEMMVTSVWDYLLSQKEQGMDPKVEGVAEAHPNSKIYDKCWTGYKKVPGKKRGEKGSCEKIGEDLDTDQKKAKQVPATEMPKKTSPVLGKAPKQHPFKGRAVGESQ